MNGFYNQKETGRPVTIKDEGITLTANVASIDLTGAGVTGSVIGAAVTENIPGSSGSVVLVDSDKTGVIEVDNTDPTNPIVYLDSLGVDGVTITGRGTVADPLVAANTGTVIGTGVAGQVAFWSATSTLTSDADFTFVTDTLTVDKVSVDDDAYGSGWNGSLLVPTRNAIYDKIETLGSLSRKSGTTTRTGDTASGNQVIAHGLGRTPTWVRITATKRNASVGLAYSQGVSDGTTHSYIAWTTFTAGAYDSNQGTSLVLIGDDDAGKLQYVDTVTLDGTNITLAWTKAGSPTSGQIKIMWEVG